MSTPKHTPGPWHVEHDVDGIPLTVIGVDNSAVGTIETWNDNAEGNRNLIAAAPAMYAALKAITDKLGETDAVIVSVMREIAKAALAQAEGRG